MDKEFYTVNEAEKILNVEKGNIYSGIRSGAVKSVVIKRTVTGAGIIHIPRSEIERLKKELGV